MFGNNTKTWQVFVLFPKEFYQIEQAHSWRSKIALTLLILSKRLMVNILSITWNETKFSVCFNAFYLYAIGFWLVERAIDEEEFHMSFIKKFLFKTDWRCSYYEFITFPQNNHCFYIRFVHTFNVHPILTCSYSVIPLLCVYSYVRKQWLF